MDERKSERHLSDDELFSLAAPAAGEPEPLPRHLSDCQSCSRALREWKGAVRDLADEDVGELDRRSLEEWRAAEEATMAAIRSGGRRGRRARALRWSIGIAASVVIGALAVPVKRSVTASTAATQPASPALSPTDSADDALLRDAAYLARGGDDNSDIDREDSL